MKLADRIRQALSPGSMYSVVQGEGVEAVILKNGVVQGVIAIPLTGKEKSC